MREILFRGKRIDNPELLEKLLRHVQNMKESERWKNAGKLWRNREGRL